MYIIRSLRIIQSKKYFAKFMIGLCNKLLVIYNKLYQCSLHKVRGKLLIIIIIIFISVVPFGVEVCLVVLVSEGKHSVALR